MEELSTIVIRKADRELLVVSDDELKRGRMVTYVAPTESGITDSFNIGLSWKSLEQLQRRMTRGIFEWATNDRSLEVIGKNGQISLRFVSQGPSLTVDTFLSIEEARSFKSALFDEDGQAERSPEPRPE